VVTRPERLTALAFAALSDAEASGDGIGVAAVTLIDLWHATRTTSRPVTPGEFRAVKQVLADASDAVEWLPPTVEVAERYEDVAYPDVKDPFDRIIVATAWAAAVATCDGGQGHQYFRQSRAGHLVRPAWVLLPRRPGVPLG
jgi:PIN domain nuclease of toxin-antitoxin system